MIKGNVLAEQVNTNGEVILDYDQKYSLDEQFAMLKKILGKNSNRWMGAITDSNPYVMRYAHDGKIELLLTLNMTYLGHPHPVFKKRAQLKNWYKEFYKKFNKNNTKVRIIGIYNYDSNIIFTEFNFDTYINRDLNNSSAHIYTNDLYQATMYGTFKRVDKNKNVIDFIRGDLFKSYLDGESMPKTAIYQLFDEFNNNFLNGKWILASDAIKEMKNANFYQWKGTEWAGWFLEYKMENFIHLKDCESQIAFVANIKDRLKKPLDFDLYFEDEDYYGDLKSSDENEKSTPANDQVNLMKAVLFHSKFWFIIYEHKTEKDKDHNNEMALARMNLIGETVEEHGHISYADRMKHSVLYTNMKILEVNSANFREFMSDFTQGHQPNGEARAPKFKIDKRNIDNFIIFSQSI